MSKANPLLKHLKASVAYAASLEINKVLPPKGERVIYERKKQLMGVDNDSCALRKQEAGRTDTQGR